MGKKVAIIQSNYVPWKGYFDIMNSVDEFILFDDVQYTKRDWRNRNIVKTEAGPAWLTIPVETRSKYQQKIRETKISDGRWGPKHWKTLLHNYSHAAHFSDYKDKFEPLYLNIGTDSLSEVNFIFIQAVCGILGIATKLSWSSQYRLEGDKTQRLLSLCRQAGASCYYTGPSAKNYIQEERFKEEGIELVYFDYSGYPAYKQLHGEFVHEVSILDLIFNEGPHASGFMKSFGRRSGA